MKRIATLVPAASLIACAAPSLAQNEAGDTSQDVQENEIFVLGEGLEQPLSTLAYATTVLERETIVSSGSGRIEDVLKNVAGFQQFRRSDSRSANPSAQGVTLRALGGNATSRALALLDGVPIADPFFGFVPLSAIAPESLAQIRVTRGGGSGPFGAGALAGTIELESAGPRELGGFAGSALVNDRAETEASASIARNLGAGFGVISGRWDRGRGFFTTPENQRVPASARAAFDNWQLGLRAVAPLSNTTELQVRVSAFDDNRTLRFGGADSSHQGQDASLRVIGRGAWEFDALAYVQARNFSNVVISSSRFTRVLDQRNTPSTGLGGKIEVRPPIGEGHTFRIGADYRRADGELQEEAFSAFTGALRERRRAGGANSNLGLFVEDDWQIGPLIVTGGLRADYTRIEDGFFRAADSGGALLRETIGDDRSDWALSWRAGAVFYASRDVELRGATYTGMRLPTLNELYRPFVVFPVVTQANADLENERLEGFELGMDWRAIRDMRLSVTAFDNRVKNAIANVTLAPNLRQRQNLPAIEARGIEAALTADFGKVSFDASLAYTNAQIAGEDASIGLDGNRPAQTPKFAASATLAWQPADGWRILGTVRHIGSQFEDDKETASLPDGTTLDFFLQAPITKGLSLVMRGENLFDEDVVTRNSGGAIDLGVSRTAWLGVRIGY